MRKRVVQVPIDERLLSELDAVSKKQGKSRAELVREACTRYVADIEEAELEKAHIEGYTRVPDEPELGESMDKLAAEVLSEESW
jgi:metal-responsive CopG/Arc/MetJ family transcriptional regulator